MQWFYHYAGVQFISFVNNYDPRARQLLHEFLQNYMQQCLLEHACTTYLHNIQTHRCRYVISVITLHTSCLWVCGCVCLFVGLLP